MLRSIYTSSLRLVCVITLFAAAGKVSMADTFTVTASPAANTTSSVANTYTNNFTSATGATSPYTYSFGNSGVTGTYTGAFAITNQTPWGGVSTNGNYITTGGNAPAPGSPAYYTLTLSSNVTYFGFYLDALDSGNQIQLFNGNTLVGQITNAQFAALFGTCSSSNSYCQISGNTSQPYGFVNITDTTGSFNKIQFTEDPYSGQNFETDNHTIGGIAATPEPGSIVLLGSGLLSLAGIVRRRLRA